VVYELQIARIRFSIDRGLAPQLTAVPHCLSLTGTKFLGVRSHQGDASPNHGRPSPPFSTTGTFDGQLGAPNAPSVTLATTAI